MAGAGDRAIIAALLLSLGGLFPIGQAKAEAGSGPSPSAIFSNFPSDIQIQGRLTGEEIAPCALFDVRLFGRRGPVRVTTSGLGDARLAPASRGACPPEGPHWAPDIELADTSASQRIGLRPAPDPAGVAERRGRLVAYAAGGPLGTAEIVVRRAPPVPLWPELKWFIGFIVPALAAFLFARWAGRRTERRQQQNDLIVFRTVDKDKLDGLVGEVKNVLARVTTYDHPGWQILQSLRTRDIIAKLPMRDKERIVRRCETDDWEGVVKLMMRLFPLHADELKQALDQARQKSKGTRKR